MARHERATGVVRKWMDEKGFGFITPEDGSKDVFVHHSGITGTGRKSLATGERVTYIAINTDQGPRAEDVQRA